MPDVYFGGIPLTAPMTTGRFVQAVRNITDEDNYMNRAKWENAGMGLSGFYGETFLLKLPTIHCYGKVLEVLKDNIWHGEFWFNVPMYNKLDHVIFPQCSSKEDAMRKVEESIAKRLVEAIYQLGLPPITFPEDGDYDRGRISDV